MKRLAEREIYRLEVNVGIYGDEETKKRLSAMDKYTEKSEKRIRQLDKIEASPAAKIQDKMSGPLKKLEGRVGSFAKTAIKRFGAVAAAGLVLAGGFGLRDTMNTFMDFEQGMQNVQAVSRATTGEMELLSNEARRLGKETEWSATQVAEAETLLAQAGFGVQENIAALPGLLDLASAGAIELGQATDITAGTLKAFGLEADKTGHLADVFAVAASSSNTDVLELGEAMKYVGPAARGLGVDVEQTTAAISLLSNANIKGSQAGTTLRSAFTRLAKPTKQSADMMRRLGFEAFDAQGELLPMNKLIGNLEKSTSDLTGEQKSNAMATIFGQEAMSGMLALVEQGPDAYQKLTDSLYDSGGAAKEMADTRLDSMAGQMKLLRSATDELKISLGEKLAPYTRDFVAWTTANVPLITEKIVALVDKTKEFATKAYPAVMTFIDGIKGAAPIIAGIASSFAAMKIGGQIQKGVKAFSRLKDVFITSKGATGGFIKGISGLMGPVGWTALAIGALVTAGILLYKNWDTIKEKASQLGNWISDKWNGIKESTSEAWESVTSLVSDKWNSLKDTVTGIGPAIKDGVLNTWDSIKTGTASKWEEVKSTTQGKLLELKSFVEDKFLSLPDSILEPLNRMGESIGAIWEGIKNVFQGYWEIIKNVFLGAMLIIVDIVTLDFESLGTDIAAIWDNIKEGFSLVWDGIKQIFTGAGEFIKEYLTLVWETLRLGIETTWTTVTEFLSNTWESITAGAIEGWSLFKEGVANIITGSVEWIKTTWDNTIEWFATLPSRLYERGVEMFTQLREGLSSMKESVSSKAQEIGQGVVDKVKNLPSEMLTIGKDIVQGLINGLGEKIGALKDKAGEVAAAAGDGIRSFLRIKSPSRVMIEYGKFTTEGLAVGMEEEIPRLERATSKSYNVITREEEKKNRIFRPGFVERVSRSIKSPRRFHQGEEPSGQVAEQPQVAVAGTGSSETIYQFSMDGMEFNFDGLGDYLEPGEVKELVEDGLQDFGERLLRSLRDKK